MNAMFSRNWLSIFIYLFFEFDILKTFVLWLFSAFLSHKSQKKKEILTFKSCVFFQFCYNYFLVYGFHFVVFFKFFVSFSSSLFFTFNQSFVLQNTSGLLQLLVKKKNLLIGVATLNCYNYKFLHWNTYYIISNRSSFRFPKTHLS